MSPPLARWEVRRRRDPPPLLYLAICAGLTVVGLWMLSVQPDALAWATTGFFGLCAAGLLAGRGGWFRGGVRESVVLDREGLRREIGGRSEAIRWSEVVYLELVTTGDSPLHEDLYLAVVEVEGVSCMVPRSAWEPLRLLDRVGRLDGVIWESVDLARSAGVDYRFPLWKGELGEAEVLGQPLDA